MELLNICFRMEMVFDMYTWFHVCCRFSSMCLIGGNDFNSKMVSAKESWRQVPSIKYYFATICHKSRNKDWANHMFGFKNWSIWSSFFIFVHFWNLTVERENNWFAFDIVLQTRTNIKQNTGFPGNRKDELPQWAWYAAFCEARLNHHQEGGEFKAR